jgi:hypothetical protein
MQAERRKPAALVWGAYGLITSVHHRGLWIQESNEKRTILDTSGQLVLDLPDQLEQQEESWLPTLDMAAMGALLSRGVRSMGTLTGQRLIRWEVVTGHWQALTGMPDASTIEVCGGSSRLAELLGEHSKKAPTAVRGILAVQSLPGWKWPDGSTGGMLSYREWPEAPGRPSLLRLHLGDFLMENAVRKLGSPDDTLEEKARRLVVVPSAARRLVPMVALLPPMLRGRPNDRGPQATLQLVIMAEFRNHARELAKRESVKIPLARWRELAKGAQLPPSLVEKVIEIWVKGGDDAPAFLTRPDKLDPWRFGLAGAYQKEDAFMRAAGRVELGGARGGEASAAKRAAALESGKRKPKRKPKPHSD